MSKFTNNDKEIILKSLGHLYVINKLNENNKKYAEFMEDQIMVHGYGTLHYDDIFDIIKEDVPELIKEYKSILNKEYNYANVDSYINNYYNTRKFDSITND